MSDFVAFARGYGLIIDSEPPAGVWRRYKTVDKPLHRNGAAKFIGSAGFVQNHATMSEVAIWHADRLSQNAVQAIASIRLAEKRKQWQAKQAMRAYFRELKPLRGGHPYLERKGLLMMGCGKVKADGELMVIPMLRSGFIQSLQTITPDGQKKYRYGCPVKGCSLELVHQGYTVTCLVEGFATGLAVYQTLRESRVIVCFDAANMVQVASEIQLAGMVAVCADNDWRTAEKIGSNPGVEKGNAAAKAIGCGAAYPTGIQGSDWCDLLMEMPDKGPGVMRMEVMRHMRMVT